MGLSERLAQYGDGVWQAVLAIVLWREPPKAASAGFGSIVETPR